MICRHDKFITAYDRLNDTEKESPFYGELEDGVKFAVQTKTEAKADAVKLEKKLEEYDKQVQEEVRQEAIAQQAQQNRKKDRVEISSACSSITKDNVLELITNYSSKARVCKFTRICFELGCTGSSSLQGYGACMNVSACKSVKKILDKLEKDGVVESESVGNCDDKDYDFMYSMIPSESDDEDDDIVLDTQSEPTAAAISRSIAESVIE